MFWEECWPKGSSCERFVKKSWDLLQSLVCGFIHFRTDWFRPIFMDLSIFFLMPLPVEPMMLKQALIGVGKMVSTTIRAFKWVGARFTLFSFKSWWVDFVIGLAAPTEFLMVFWLVWAIAFDTPGSLNSAWKCGVAPLPAIFTLRYTRVYVGTMDCHDIIPDIEAPIY